MNRERAVALGLRNAVDGLANYVKQAAFHALAGGHRHGRAQVAYLGSAGQAFGRVHGNGPHPVLAQMLLAFQHHYLAVVFRDFERVEDVGQLRVFTREAHVHDGADDLGDFAGIRHCAVFSRKLLRFSGRKITAEARFFQPHFARGPLRANEAPLAALPRENQSLISQQPL